MSNELIKNNFKDIANAIRNKTGENGLIKADEMASKINGIEAGVDTSICMNWNNISFLALMGLCAPDSDIGDDINALVTDLRESGKWYALLPINGEEAEPVECIIDYIEPTYYEYEQRYASADIYCYVLNDGSRYLGSFSIETNMETGDSRIVYGTFEPNEQEGE